MGFSKLHIPSLMLTPPSSDEEAENFYNNVLELIKDNNQVNMGILNFWKNA